MLFVLRNSVFNASDKYLTYIHASILPKDKNPVHPALGKKPLKSIRVIPSAVARTQMSRGNISNFFKGNIWCLSQPDRKSTAIQVRA